MRAGLVYLRPKQVVFVRSTGPYAVSSLAAWSGMLSWIDRHNLTRDAGCGYGLQVDDPNATSPQHCRYDACITLPDGFIAPRDDTLPFQTLPGGAFARIRHVGPYDTARTSIARVRDQWLSGQPHLLADRRRPLLTIYLDHPNRREAGSLRCDVCVPVRTEHEEPYRRAKFEKSAAA